MADPLCTAQDLIDRLDGGAEELRRLAGDDGTGAYDSTSVTNAIDAASGEGYGILLAGFSSNDTVAALVANDPTVLNAICLLVRYHLTLWKREFRLPDGASMFQRDAREARDLLREKSRGGQRSSAEEVTPNGPGRSALLQPRTASNIPSVIVDRYRRPVGF